MLLSAVAANLANSEPMGSGMDLTQRRAGFASRRVPMAAANVRLRAAGYSFAADVAKHPLWETPMRAVCGLTTFANWPASSSRGRDARFAYKNVVGLTPGEPNRHCCTVILENKKNGRLKRSLTKAVRHIDGLCSS